MNIIIALLAVYISIRINTSEARDRTTPHLSDDIQILLNSLYNAGFLPEYLQEELSESEKSNGDYLEFPDFNNTQGNAESLNHPSWLSCQKEVFVPPESEYKNIIAHKNEKAHQKIAPFIDPSSVLWNQLWRRPFLDPQELRAELLVPLAGGLNSNLTGNISQSLDFLLPIPERGRLPATSGAGQPLLQGIPPGEKVPQLTSKTESMSAPGKNMPHKPLNVNQVQNSGNQQNSVIGSPLPVISNNPPQPLTPRFGSSENIQENSNIKSQPSSLNNVKLNELQEMRTTELKNIQKPIDESNKPKNKKKIFSFLKVFKKERKKILSNQSENSTFQKALMKKGKPATLQELYEQLIDTRNLYERNNIIQPQNEEIEDLSNIISEGNNGLQKVEPFEESFSQELRKSIFNEQKAKMPQIYQRKRRK